MRMLRTTVILLAHFLPASRADSVPYFIPFNGIIQSRQNCKIKAYMATNLQTLKGFRDFLPAEKRLRDLLSEKIKSTFRRFGFEPLETPTLEYASLLLGKYGAEADKLVYTFSDKGDRQVGLRYDQTVPTARVLAQYQSDLPKYFRRYQIQNVFRADKPQKGRFREFTQCDIDVLGSTDAIADAEILACAYASFQEVGFTTVILKVNDRQVLFSTLTPFATEKVSVMSLIQSIDKLDKQTVDEVVSELISKGLDEKSARAALSALAIAKPSENLQNILKLAQALGVPADRLQFSSNLARGLDYYTGMIFEITIPEYSLGSFGGGGRYDQLIEQLGGPTMPAVGVAFGFDRMVEAAKEKQLFSQGQQSTATVLMTIFSAELTEQNLAIAQQLRQAGIATEVYPSVDKLGKQFKIADQKGIPWVAVVGQDELATGTINLKKLSDRTQQTVSITEAIKLLKK